MVSSSREWTFAAGSGRGQMTSLSAQDLTFSHHPKGSRTTCQQISKRFHNSSAMLIDLNCDLGEGCPNDAELMPLITSANVACGGHVPPALIAPTLKLAKRHGVQVGAHPSFLDTEHFGRRELDLPPAQVHDDVERQLRLLAA